MGLPRANRRAAIQQSRKDRYPEEYGDMIEQYFEESLGTSGGSK